MLPLIPAAAVAIAIAKKKENKRKQAAANEFSGKYPLVDECTEMNDLIVQAKKELSIINSSPAISKAAKRVKDRNKKALASWLEIMSNHGKDLTCGLNFGSTNYTPPIINASLLKNEGDNIPPTPPSSPNYGASNQPPPLTASDSNISNAGMPVQPTDGGQNGTPTPTTEKPPKKSNMMYYLLGGGIAAFVLYKIIKRK